MKKMRTIFLAAAVLGTVALTACGGSGSTGEDVREGE